MKKYILLVLFSLLITFGIKSYASTWSYKWYDTTVEVPVGESIYDYEKIPKAKLYKDGVELEDADVTIVTTGDWLYYLANVNTEVVGEYKVWYKAYEYNYMPGTCHDYKCIITFKVVDKEKPKIIPITDSIRISSGTSNYNLSDYFNFIDNYDKNLDIDFINNIDTKKAGIYDCSIVVLDDSLNEARYDFKVEIYNTGTPPRIEKLVDKIKIKKDSKIDLNQYFKVIDDDLDFVTVTFYEAIDTSKCGIYNCKITASDPYDTISLDFEVEVYDDNLAPTIIKLIDDIKIECGTKNVNLKDYFIITDDYDLDIKPIFSHSINFNKIGIYPCKITVKDSSNKISELEFVVEIFGDDTNPTIEQMVDKIRIKRKSKFNLLEYFSISDDSDDVKVEFYGSIDNMYVGFYECKIMARDSNGNSTVHSFVVEIYDDVKPVITFLGEGNELNLYLNQEVSIKSYFKAVDDIDGDISFDIVYPAVDKKTPKSIDYTVSVSDQAGNVGSLTIKLNVIDDIIPEIILYTENIILEYGFELENIDYLSYVKTLKDNNIELDKKELTIESTLCSAVGEYLVIYSYSDSQNIIVKELKINVLSSKPPTITVENIEVYQNEILDLSSYITVYDESDPKAHETLTVNTEMVDYSKPGRYEATANAVNSSALSTTVTFYVVVKEKNIFDNDIVKYLSIGICVLLIVSLSATYFIKNKKIKMFK